jgi:protein SCO1/2
MKHAAALLTLAALLAVATTSCAKRVVTYDVKGTIRELLDDRKTVKIAHEAIPGYMPAMTMNLSVTNEAELSGLQPGDIVSFRMVVTPDDGWIDQVRKIGSTNAPATPAPESLRRVRYVEPLSIGDALPEYHLTNQLGTPIRLSEFKGRALLMNFIFTRCPFPTFCPRASKGFQEVQEQLKARPGGPTNWHLLSITIDPAYDTTTRLRGYAKTYDADPGRWSFATGTLEDITALAEQFGLQFWRETPEALPNHNLRTVVIDAAGKVQWVTVENEWKTEAVVEQVLKAATLR